MLSSPLIAPTTSYLSLSHPSLIRSSSLLHSTASLAFAPVAPECVAEASRLLLTGSFHSSAKSSSLSLSRLSVASSPLSSSAGTSHFHLDEHEEPLSPPLSLFALQGHVEALSWATPSLFAAATSTGDLSLLSVQSHNRRCQMKLIASVKESALSLNAIDYSSWLGCFAVGGEHSILSLYDSTLRLTRRIEHAIFTPLFKVAFAGSSTLYGSGGNGLISVFDLRQSTQDQVANRVKCSRGGDLLAMSVHPARLDTICVGSSDGIISTFDLRKQDLPLLEFAHSSVVIREVSFLPFDPTIVLVADEEGTLTSYSFNTAHIDPSLVQYDGCVNERNEERINPSAIALYQSPHRHAFSALDIDRTSHTVAATNVMSQLIHFTYSLS